MVNGKQYQLSPQASDNTEFDNSRAVSVRDFKILRQRTAEDKSLLETQILANAEAITLRATQSYVDSGVAGLQSQITVQAGQIALKVSSTDYNGNTIASLINQTATTIAISASKINLTGYVTLTNLSTEGQTTINGGNITTGTLSADRISGGTINGTNVNITNLNASNINAGSLSVDRLTTGSVSGWYFGASTISRSGITLGADFISLANTGTGGSTINLGTAKIYNQGGNTVAISGALYATSTFRVDGQTTSQTILPASNNTYSLGTSSFRWASIWQNSGSVTGSDRVLKKDIQPIGEAVAFISKLKPVKYAMKDGSSGRMHYGFIAQEVKDALDLSGVDAGIYVDPVVKETPENGAGYAKALRYEEFIAPAIATIQNLLNRVEVLENERKV